MARPLRRLAEPLRPVSSLARRHLRHSLCTFRHGQRFDGFGRIQTPPLAVVQESGDRTQVMAVEPEVQFEVVAEDVEELGDRFGVEVAKDGFQTMYATGKPVKD